MRLKLRSIILLAFLCVAMNGTAQNLNAILKAAPNSEATWSVTVRDQDGKILESWNSDKLIIPASNQKLFTTAAVLDGLGSNFRYETVVYGSGEQKGSMWHGYLIVKGSGDPSISGFMYNEDRYHVFRSLAEQIKEKNITEYTEAVFGDISYFDEQIYPKGWDWDDLSFYYGVEISPLSFNNNAVDLLVDANGDIGDVPLISWFPDSTGYVKFINEQIIDAPNTEYDEYYRRELGENTITLRSSLPQGYLEEESLSIDNAPMFFLNTFIDYLEDEGITGEYKAYGVIELGGIHKFSSYGEMAVLATHTSEPLSKLVEWANKESDNFYTEMMLKTLAAEKVGEPGTFENGITEVRNFLGQIGIDTAYVVMKDGSGMASGNFTKTAVLSDFLVKMKGHSEFGAFYNSLSVAGINGTIAHRMKGTPLFNNFRGKSGFMSGVRTLSGYLTTRTGKQLIVSLSANNFVSEKIRPIDGVHEQILQYLYEKY